MTSQKTEDISSKNNGNGNGKPKNSSPKKFLFVSDESLSGDLAWQIKKEGHDVKAYDFIHYNWDTIKENIKNITMNIPDLI